MAGSVCVKPDFALFAARIRAEATDNWDDKVAVDRFVGQGGRFVRGSGRLVGSGTILIEPADSEGESVRMAARRGVVLATGTQPSALPIPGLAKTVLGASTDRMGISFCTELRIWEPVLTCVALVNDWPSLGIVDVGFVGL